MTCHRHTAIRSNPRISQRERLNLGRSSIGENGGERERERASGSYTCGCGRRGNRRRSRCSSVGGSSGGRSGCRACASCSGACRSCPYPSPAKITDAAARSSTLLARRENTDGGGGGGARVPFLGRCSGRLGFEAEARGRPSWVGRSGGVGEERGKTLALYSCRYIRTFDRRMGRSDLSRGLFPGLLPSVFCYGIWAFTNPMERILTGAQQQLAQEWPERSQATR